MNKETGKFNELKKIVNVLICLLGLGLYIYGQKVDKPIILQPSKVSNENSATIPTWNQERKPGSARKLALLIGISDYTSKCKPQIGKPCISQNLHTKTELDQLSQVLSDKEFGFEFEVVTLRDSQATHQNIKQAFEKLTSLIKEGDIVYIHYSGHGTYLPDQPPPYGDEIDGWDEAIVPFDYGYRGNIDGVIRDDEIGQWIDALEDKKPLNITVTFDSCNSGTATRGGLKRGVDWMQTPIVKTPSRRNLPGKSQKPRPGFVYISAAGSAEPAIETDAEPRMGEFSRALIQTLRDAKSDTTYQDAFERIKDLVTSNQGSQNPEIEGDSYHDKLFGNSVIPTEKYFSIKAEGANFMLQAGKLHGMRVGSKFAIYVAGTKRVSKEGKGKLTDAEIVRTDPLVSVLKFVRPVKPADLIGARAFETARKFDIDALKVAFNNLPESEGKIIEETVKSYEFVQPLSRGSEKSRSYDVLFRTRNKELDPELRASDGNLVMERSNGSVRVFSSNGEQLKLDIKDALEQEVRWKTVKELENDHSDLKVEMRIVPVHIQLNSDNKREPNDFGTPIEPSIGTSGLEFKLGDFFRIEVRNSSEFPVYITIFSLSDGKIQADFPKSSAERNDKANKIDNDGEWKSLIVSRITPPVGIEGFKLIATKDSADFSNLEDTKGPGKTLPIGQILRMLSNGTRGTNPLEPTPSETWATSTITYKIKCPVINGVEKCREDDK